MIKLLLSQLKAYFWTFSTMVVHLASVLVNKLLTTTWIKKKFGKPLSQS